jgi:hypothetical protein
MACKIQDEHGLVKGTPPLHEAVSKMISKTSLLGKQGGLLGRGILAPKCLVCFI